MSQDVVDAGLNLGRAGEESSMSSAPAPRDFIPTTSDNSDLTIPISMFPPGRLSSQQHETWKPIYMHTAKCDRCQQHNTSVVQRSSHRNLQFCKVCMYLNINDGIYVVDDGNLDWTPQTVSNHARVRGPNKHRRTPKKSKKKLSVTSGPKRVSKRKRKEPQNPATKRRRLAKQPTSENRSNSSLFVTEYEAGDEAEETDDDIGFGQLPSGSGFSSEGRTMRFREIVKVAETAENRETTQKDDKQARDSKGKENEKMPGGYSNNSHLAPYWTETQAPVSHLRDENHEIFRRSNVHFSLLEERGSERSFDEWDAADVLTMMSSSHR